MRRFRFRLDKLLRLRSQAERGARRVLATEVSALTALEVGMADIDACICACREEEPLLASGGQKTSRLLAAVQHGLERKRVRIEAAMNAARERVTAARDAYRRFHQDAEAVRSLRSRRYEEWREASLAEEQRELDELTQARFVARTRGRTAR